MKLQLERPDTSAISNVPKAVRAASSPAKAQRAGVHIETEGTSRDPISLPSHDPVPTAATSSKSVTADTSSQPGLAVAAVNRGKQEEDSPNFLGHSGGSG